MAPKDAPYHDPALVRQKRRWGYLKRMLLPDEYVLHVARLHWTIYISSLTWLVFGILLLHYGTLPAGYLFGSVVEGYVTMPVRVLALFCIAVGVMYVFFVSIRFVATELVVTNQRFIYKRGLIAPTILQATITKISSVDIEQTLTGRLLDYGDCTVRSSGQDIPPIKDVADPYSLYYHVMKSARLEVHPEMEAAPQPPETIPEKPLPPPAQKLAPPPKPAKTPDQETIGNHDDDEED